MRKTVKKSSFCPVCYLFAIILCINIFWNIKAVPAKAEGPGLEYETQAAVPDQDDNYGPDIMGETYCVIDGDTGEVLLAKNKDRRMYPASTTKILTALLVIENVPDLNSPMTFTASAVNIDPSSSTLEPKACAGETMSVREALYGLMLKSANECGAMLGEYVAGSEEAFAQMMNDRARQIGAVNSHFMNAYGIHHEEHYTTAYDLSLIMQEAMKNETFRTIAGTASYTMQPTNMAGARSIVNSHKMITGDFPEEGVLAGKTGSTPQAGRVLVTAVRRENMYTIATVMGDNIENYYQDTQVILSFAYDLKADRIRPVEWVPVNDNVTAADGVHIRYSPSTQGGIYTTLLQGQQVHRNGIYNEWSRVIYGGRYGYICTDFLISDQPEQVPSTEEYTGTEAETEPEPESPSEIVVDISESAAPVSTESVFPNSGPGATNAYERTEEDVKKNTWRIVLIVIGSLIGALFLAFLILWIINNQRRRKRRRRRKKQQNRQHSEKKR